MSKSGGVGTYGGLKIPPVTIFMDGFVDGVAQYNKVKGKNVKVLGWDKVAQNGSFAGSFTDQNGGKRLSRQFVAQKGGGIMPVAGGTGPGHPAGGPPVHSALHPILGGTGGWMGAHHDL